VTNKLVGRKSADAFGLEVPKSKMTKQDQKFDEALCADTVEERLHWNLLAEARNIGMVQKQVASMIKFGSLPPIRCLCGAKSVYHPCQATPPQLVMYWNMKGLDMVQKCNCVLHDYVSKDMPMHPTPEQLAKNKGRKVVIPNQHGLLDSVNPKVPGKSDTKTQPNSPKIPSLMDIVVPPPQRVISPLRVTEEVAKVEQPHSKSVKKNAPLAIRHKVIIQKTEAEPVYGKLTPITEEGEEHQLVIEERREGNGVGIVHAPQRRQEPPTIIVPPAAEAIVIERNCEITRKATLWNRVVLAKQPSRFNFNTIIGNHHIGQLVLRKDQKSHTTVPDSYYDEKLANYLLREKFASYKDRKETLDHMTKLARKYLQEFKVDFINYTPQQVIIHNATIQKIVDECTIGFILAQDTANKERSRVKLWWYKMCRSNQYASKN